MENIFQLWLLLEALLYLGWPENFLVAIPGNMEILLRKFQVLGGVAIFERGQHQGVDSVLPLELEVFVVLKKSGEKFGFWG